MYALSWKEIEQIMEYRHSRASIQRKAFRSLGYSNDRSWSNEEIEIIKNNYKNITVDEICEMLPNRTRDCIIMYASKFGIKSPTNRAYSDYENEYIINNWEIEPDIIISKVLNRTQRAIKYQRCNLGLFRMDKTRNYSRLGDYLRRNSIEWKTKSIEICNFECIVTGSKDFEVHHVTPVNIIIDTILKENSICKKEFKNYTERELSIILKSFKTIQNYEYGICIDKKIHLLFHKLYGYNTNKIQLFKFIDDYKKGTYNKYNKQINI